MSAGCHTPGKRLFVGMNTMHCAPWLFQTSDPDIGCLLGGVLCLSGAPSLDPQQQWKPRKAVGSTGRQEGPGHAPGALISLGTKREKLRPWGDFFLPFSSSKPRYHFHLCA